ncbi:MAG: HK97 gp10 family phage protein [Ruminococcaceae bacterium]|nr:HK97 gp10 family phage protein [Oscillospiraceae bacterium]
MSIGIDELSEAIMKEMEAYTQEVESVTGEKLDEISKQLVFSLRNNPNIPVRTGKYKKSFYFKTVAKGRGYHRNVIANRRYYMTHLLEDGHAIHGGTSRTNKHPHWSEAEKLAKKLLEGFSL